MPRLTPPPTAPLLRRHRRGVTLVELLIAITILGIVGSLVLSVLTQQQRFYRDTNDMLAQRRELRAGASMLPMDVRGISSIGGDVYTMNPTELSFAGNYGSAVVCAVGLGTPGYIEIAATDLKHHSLASYYTKPQVGDTVFIFDDGTDFGAGEDNWQHFGIRAEPTPTTDACAVSAYVDATDDAGKQGLKIPIEGTIPSTILPGAVVRLTRPVKYTLFQPTAGTGKPYYLGFSEWVVDAWSTTDMVSGPFDPLDSSDPSQSGVAFAYFSETNAPLTDAATQGTQLARVEVRLRVMSSTERALTRAFVRDSAVVKIAIRNRS